MNIIRSILFIAVLAQSAAGYEVVELNVFKIKDDKQKVKTIMDKVSKSQRPCIGRSTLMIAQHIEGKNYLIRRGQLPVEAVTMVDSETTLHDGKQLQGYLLPSEKTYTYTTVLGAKATVKLSDFRGLNYPFESEDNFIKLLMIGIKFSFFGEPVKCAKCTGWGKVRAKTPSGWNKCDPCDGSGKVPSIHSVLWKE